MNTCKPAVLFVVFQRTDTATRVFQRIRAAKPPRLYLASDGPRKGVAGEQALVESIRRMILSSVDWPCKVETLFRDTNLGCHASMESAISWFFRHEEEGIILEDDCLPEPDFFRFCAEMLDRYRHNEQVMSITGDLFARLPGEMDSYYFSRFPSIWGWATWRRA